MKIETLKAIHHNQITTLRGSFPRNSSRKCHEWYEEKTRIFCAYL